MTITATEATAQEPQLDAGAWLLRPWREEDTDGLYRAVIASLEELGRWLPWARPDYAREHTIDWIARCQRDWRERSGYPFGVFAAGSGEVVGAVGINQIDGVHRRGNLGYWVATASAGQGVARSAARAAAGFAFRELALCRLEIVALPDNNASCRVAEALGAQWECRARHRVQHHGQPADAEVYSLLPGDLSGADN
jgi:ribosomal-protein-serine acetyltransferase